MKIYYGKGKTIQDFTLVCFNWAPPYHHNVHGVHSTCWFLFVFFPFSPTYFPTFSDTFTQIYLVPNPETVSFVLSITAEEPETRQHCDPAWHHPHRTLPDPGLWISGEYFYKAYFKYPVVLLWLSSQDSDLKQYLDNCGNLMSMHNVKVSHKHHVRVLAKEISNCFSRVSLSDHY